MGRLKTVLNKPIEPNNGVVPRKEGLWFAAGVAGQNISCGLVGSVLNVIPLLFIRYPDSLKQQVEADLKARRAESAAQAHSAARETTADA